MRILSAIMKLLLCHVCHVIAKPLLQCFFSAHQMVKIIPISGLSNNEGTPQHTPLGYPSFSSDPMHTPKMINMSRYKIVSISCHGYHSIALLNIVPGQTVYTCYRKTELIISTSSGSIFYCT